MGPITRDDVVTHADLARENRAIEDRLRARVAELERQLAACRPRRYTAAELGGDLGEIERQVEAGRSEKPG